ncbi:MULTISPECIES: transglutaminase family protein [Spirosoma]|uniref:Transglutaminase family protein n=1 Tax=Spirosoma liriopis TaxID=2937440 RepID=A0ABT0HV62_9BACT|nr:MULTISPECIES: transglutaminase family protein [Spirosoma]MCK8495503.1 transglutaminase family protein [Spirosoma liriopis]UHG94516.1 transglutaminase family protein [Spirosoma oryzicola]
MAIWVQLTHQTLYQYERMVYLSTQLIRLKPTAYCQAVIEDYSLTIQPANHVLHWQQDPFGNFIARVDFLEKVTRLSIQVQLTANLQSINSFDFLIDEYALFFPFEYTDSLQHDLAPYRGATEHGAYLTQWIGQISHQSRQETVSFLINLTQQVCQAIIYQVRLQPGVQAADETLRRSTGSCRDCAWLLVQLVRKLGLAARFVSGYLVELSDSLSDTSTDATRDSLALHAWTEVYLPGAGWLGLDPTSGMVVTEAYIPLASSPDPVGAAVISGTTDSAQATLSYSSTVVHLP